MAKLVTVLLVSAALCGCDLNANLVIKNRSGAPARVRLVEDRNAVTSEHTITLTELGPESRGLVSMGFWSCFRGSALEENVARFQRIDIISMNDSTSFSGAELRAKFIQGRRPGLFGCMCNWKIR